MRKLTTITTQYSKFSDNQVLTKGQLNEFLDYFEDRDHLSRIALSGVGIVCGFKLKFNAVTNEIAISTGYGITTDGDLLTLVEPKPITEIESQQNGLQLITNAFKFYTHYQVFEDNKANYQPFFYSGETPINLLEIFHVSEIDLSSGLYTSLRDLEDIQDKVVLLYLENYPKEGDLCTTLDCDNQGIEQIARLRVLLVSNNDARTIASQDSILTEQSIEDYLNLPEIAVLRDILNAGNTKDYQSLKRTYFNLISNDAITNIGKSFDIILKKFNKPPISVSISSLFEMSPSAIPVDFQYRYDILKDLVATYVEIKSLLFHLNVLCCPSIDAFPKHLLLGSLKQPQPQFESLRHRFYKSPIIGHEDDHLQTVKSLLDKAHHLVANYLKVSKETEIIITPSQAHGVLSNKAIPFYYNINAGFLNYWSYSKYKNFSQTSNLGYYAANASSVPSIRQPLSYAIDDYNFLRIEGIQGKPYREALDRIIALKEKYGLSFDVKTLSVNATTSNININDYQCQFEDLSILLKAWRTEQNCVLAEMSRFFSAFSTIEAGSNLVAIDRGYERYKNAVARDTIETNRVSEELRKSEHTRLEESRRRRESISDFGEGKHFDAKEARYKEFYNRRNLYQPNVVKEQLTTLDNTVGKYFESAISENEQGSANDIMANFRENTKGIMASEVWKEQASLAEFIFEDVAATLAYSYVLDKRIPIGIHEIDDSTLTKYKFTIDELCKRIKGMQAKYEDTNIKEGSKQILGLLINQMSTVCCSGKKLEILLEEIENRKLAILKQIQLSEFVKKHPGLRHQAGVPIGGTFIMAYLTENAANESTYATVRMELGFVAQPKSLVGKEENDGFIKLFDDRASTSFLFVDEKKKMLDIGKELSRRNKHTTVGIGKTLEETVGNLASFLNYTWEVAGFSKNCKATAKGKVLIIELIDQHIIKNANYIQFSDMRIFGGTIDGGKKSNKTGKIFFDENEIIKGKSTAKNIVIADFSLPYMCCSDCTPINFIVPREPVSLSLPTDVICLEKGTLPLTFTVSPKDGEVKALVEDDVNGGVIKNEDGVYQFDAQALDASLYGKNIKFTVNDQDTNASISVNKMVVAEVFTTVTYDNDHKTATVNYTVTGEGISETTVFNWDFDNELTSDEIPDENGEVSVVYELPVNSDNVIKPTLSISNGPCTFNSIIPPITFEDSGIELIIEGSPFCINSDQGESIEIPFDLKPNKSKLGINGTFEGIKVKDNKKIIVDSKIFSAYNTPIGFTVEGENLPDSPTITIINKTDFASFEYEPKNPSVNQGTETVVVNFKILGLTEQQVKNYDFHWDFGDESKSNKNDTDHEFDISNQKEGEVVFHVILIIKGGPCGVIEIPQDVKIIINKKDDDTDNPENCLATVEADIKKDRESLNAVADIDQALKKMILQPTIDLFEEVLKSISEYLSGNKNDKLNNLFSELIQKTAQELLENEKDGYVKDILSNYLGAQIRLFYSILHCQSDDQIAKHIEVIDKVSRVIEKALMKLKEKEVRFDTGNPETRASEGSLRKFINDYLNDPKVPQGAKSRIKTLPELILPIK